MEELQPQDIEELLQELEEEYSADEVVAPEVETEVRVCPECGKHNLENAWHCIDCGTTLSIKTLVNIEDGQPSGLSGISPYFEQDVAELLDTALQDDESVVWGCNITRISRQPPFRFGYLLVTSRQLICVEFESEVAGRERELLGCLLAGLLAGLLSLFTGDGDGFNLGISGQEVRPKRPWIGGSTVPAVNYPSYPLTPKELASRRGAVYDLENLVSADLESAWFGDMLFVSLTARFHEDRKATFTFYSPHEAREARKLIVEHSEQPVQTTQTAQPTAISRLKGEMGFGERQQGSVTPEELSAPGEDAEASLTETSVPVDHEASQKRRSVVAASLAIVLAWAAAVFFGSSVDSFAVGGTWNPLWLAERLPSILDGTSGDLSHGFCCTLPVLALALFFLWIATGRAFSTGRLNRSSFALAVIAGVVIALVGGCITGYFGVVYWYF